MSKNDRIVADCTECRWRFFQSHADELSGLSGDPMDDIIDRQLTAHELVTEHEAEFVDRPVNTGDVQ